MRKPVQLQIGAAHCSFSVAGEWHVALDLGAVSLARQHFAQHPPRPLGLEQAIDSIEDALMKLALPASHATELVCSSAWWDQAPALRAMPQPLSREQVEAAFGHLAAWSLGDPRPAAQVPASREAAAALLLLRECMHHLRFDSVWLQGTPAGTPAAG